LGGNAQVWRTLMQFGRIARESCNDGGNTAAIARDNDGHTAAVAASSTKQGNDSDDDDHVSDADDESNLSSKPSHMPLSYSNWRILTPEEIQSHQQLSEIDPQTGEYTFRTYDLSHVVERRYKNLSLQDLSIAEEHDPRCRRGLVTQCLTHIRGHGIGHRPIHRIER
jgi:hypothetical protein